MSWPLVALKDCCRVVSGGTPKTDIPEYWGGAHYWVTPKDLSSLNSIYINETPERITDSGLKNSSAEMLPIGTVLFSSRAPIGHIAITSTTMCTNQGFKSFIPGKSVDALYLYFCLKYHTPELQALGNGATFKEVSKRVVEEYKIPLPPLATQKHIARVLEQADQLRKQAQQMESELNQLAQSLFLEMFGDPIENPKGWKKEPLQNLMTIKRGSSPRPIEKFVGGTIPWIKIGDATSGDDIYIYETKEKIIEAGLSKTVFLEPGSVIFANCGVSLGFARILKIHGCIHDGWLSFSEIDESRINKVFLLKAINSITEHFRRMAPEGTQPNLNTGLMKSFEMTAPPIELQNSFEKLIVEISERKQEAKGKSEHFDLLFNSLMQRAFNGELTAPERKAA